ncbi:MAG: hypothetical protein QW292_13955 [Candidatus Parvarchaeota archaeon]
MAPKGDYNKGKAIRIYDKVEVIIERALAWNKRRITRFIPKRS